MTVHLSHLPRSWKTALFGAIVTMIAGAVTTYYASTSDIEAAEKAAEQAEKKMPADTAQQTAAAAAQETEEVPESFLPEPYTPPHPPEEAPIEKIELPSGQAHTFVVQYANAGKSYQVSPSETWLNESPMAEHEAESASAPVDFSRVLTSSKVIPAVLYTDIQSELPSDSVRAQVEQDVIGYHDWNVLIPKGSWVMGRYAPLKRYGDTRIAVEWYRVITPEGINIDFSAYASEASGKEGLGGKLDNKFSEKYGAALLFAAINTGVQLSIDTGSQNNRAIAQALNQPLGEVTQESLRQSMQIAPTIEIKKGTRVMIHSAVDLYFPEPKQNEVQVTPLPANQSEWRDAINESDEARLEKEAERLSKKNKAPKKRKKS